MGLGLAVLGLAGFAFLGIVGNTVSASEKVALTNLYMIINVIGPGLFVSLEQEANRVVSSGVAAGVDPRPGLRRAAWLGLGLVGLTVVVMLAISPVLVSRNLDGHSSLLVWVLVSALASMAVFYVRGVLAAGNQYDGYAATLGMEGLFRLVACFAVATIGSATVDRYGLAYVLATIVAVLVAVPWLRKVFRALREQPPVDASPESRAAVTEGHTTGKIAKGLALLGAATLLAQLVANLAPIVVSARLLTDKELVAAFGFAFVLTRVPLLVFGPVQSMMLPALTAAAVRGDFAEVRGRVRVILLAVFAVGLTGAIGSALLGPWLVVHVFNATVWPSWQVMGLLGLSTVLLMIAQVLQPALVALGRHHTVTVAWVIGTAVLVAMLALPGDPIAVAVAAQLVGPFLVAVVAFAGLWRGLRSAPQPVAVS
ncbi:lipopolysaccharide biosynthesis protein [Crossiella equi]|nr:hypothetical protein [Crossiella equi]